MKIKNTFSAILAFGLFSLSTGCSSPNFSFTSPQNEAFSSSIQEPFKVLKTLNKVKYWDKMELIKTGDASIPEEKIHFRGRHRDADIVNCFGSEQPSSQFFCLHDAGLPKKQKYETPVLLIHGANTTATRSWADPDGNGKRNGLMQSLKENGYRVFAVTFANKHGDNFIWSSHINTAIQRISKLTGAKKVDAIGHSKGGFALRMYVSNVNNGNNPFAKNVNKAIFIGTPHRGVDYTFRHPIVNWALYPDSDDPVKYAPLSWTKILWKGVWRDAKELSFLGDYFNGQSQMISRLDKVHPLPVVEQDWFTTYNGGQGFVSYSSGIDEVIAKGGNLVEKIKKSPVDVSVKIANLVGKKPDVPGILNENSGASDGIVFVNSANATNDLTASGAKMIAEKVLNLNHLELVSHPEALVWINEQLSE